MIKPVIVDSTQCHLWTDALHARQLAREARNKWDRGTYIRFCIVYAWITLETSCQEALENRKIGYSFKDDIDKALRESGISSINWGSGVWQRVIGIQNIRKNFVHRFHQLNEMFPEVVVADDAIITIQEAVKDIFSIAGKDSPTWIDIMNVRGWDKESNFGIATISQAHHGSSFEDPNTRRVYMVVGGEKKLTSVFPSGYDTSDTVNQLIGSVSIPIQAIRVYDCGELVEDYIVMMRGN